MTIQERPTAYLDPNWKDYNTRRSIMAMPEYGRNIQRMVLSLLSIEDRHVRSQQAQAVIAIMGSLFPHLRNIDDFKHKLWDHLFIMSGFRLDIESPYPMPSAESFNTKPDMVPYSNPDEVEQRHYGRYIPNMVWYAAKLPVSPARSAIIKSIANHMKRIYLLWNKDVVTDDIIFKDIETLSGGRIHMEGMQRLRVGNYSNPPNEKQRQRKLLPNANQYGTRNAPQSGGKQ
jgi:hypothetical protein